VLCRNALTYILFAEGIPYIYYGTEQGYTVDREPLWHSGYSREHPLWLFLRISVAYRKEAKVRVALFVLSFSMVVLTCSTVGLWLSQRFG
jgi:glycosidase